MCSLLPSDTSAACFALALLLLLLSDSSSALDEEGESLTENPKQRARELGQWK